MPIASTRRRYVRAAVLVAACAGLTSCHGGTAAHPGAVPGGHRARAATAAPDGWSTVATFRGDGTSTQDTAQFTLRATEVRLVYTVQPNDEGPVPLMWKLIGTAISDPVASDSCAARDGQQTDDLGRPRAGSYHLRVLTSRPWTLTVEEKS